MLVVVQVLCIVAMHFTRETNKFAAKQKREKNPAHTNTHTGTTTKQCFGARRSPPFAPSRSASSHLRYIIAPSSTAVAMHSKMGNYMNADPSLPILTASHNASEECRVHPATTRMERERLVATGGNRGEIANIPTHTKHGETMPCSSSSKCINLLMEANLPFSTISEER